MRDIDAQTQFVLRLKDRKKIRITSSNNTLEDQSWSQNFLKITIILFKKYCHPPTFNHFGKEIGMF